MLTDARSLDSGTRREVDICVIGAGAAGITLALELDGSGLSVLVLESGGTDLEPATQDLHAGEVVGRPLTTLDSTVRLDQTRLRYLGGTTNHWAGFCRQLHPIDFEERDGLRLSGWPIAHADVLPYWDRATEWVRITDNDFRVETWEERLGLPAPTLRTDKVEPFVFQTTYPTVFGRLYRREMEASENVEVMLHANVVNLATDTGRSVRAVDVRTLEGTALEVTASAFVLATGGIENARILLSSTDADPGGLANGTDQVGRHFAEHLQVYAGFGVAADGPEELAGLTGGEVAIESGRHAGARHGVKYAIGLTDDHLRSTDTTGVEVQILAGDLATAGPFEPEDAIDTTDVGALLGHQSTPPGSAIYLQALAEQELDPESRVGLGAATDALGMRRVELDWRYSAADRARIVDGLRTIAEAAGETGWGRMQLLPGGVHADAVDNMIRGEFLTVYRSAPSERDLENFPIGIGYHHMCTTRMSTDPAVGVVDADCRAHEVDNLWIAGSSVFGTPGVATPTFTIVALAIRLADHLKAVLA
ncbi:MAG: GMC family oxidoreductase [Acidimicrobiales bacterium]